MENLVDNISNETFWFKKRVFITGANGFLGYWVTEKLLNLGSEVVILVRDVIPNSLLNDLFQDKRIVAIINGDLRDRDLLVRVLNEYEIEYCFHLAAQAIVGVANRNPVSTFESNIMGTWNILEASRIVGLKGVVVASSDKVYGDQKELPIKENQCMLAKYPYEVNHEKTGSPVGDFCVFSDPALC
jgi:CDP-glucose 4,6-dehydratase